MIARTHDTEDDRQLDPEQYDNLCALVLERMDELDAEGDEFADAVLAGSASFVEFLAARPHWANVVRDLVRLKLHDFEHELHEDELGRDDGE